MSAERLADRIVNGQLAVGQAASSSQGLADLQARMAEVAAAAARAGSVAYWFVDAPGRVRLAHDCGRLPLNARELAEDLSRRGSELSSAERALLRDRPGADEGGAAAAVWRAGGRQVGIVCAHQPRVGSFTDDDALVLQTVSNSVGNVVEREETAERLRATVENLRMVEERLARVIHISERLNSTRDPRELLDALVSGAMALLGCPAGFAGLQRPEGVVTRTLLRGEETLPFEHLWRPGDGIPGTCALTKRIYLANDLADDPHTDPTVRALGARCMMCAPVVDAEGQVLGFFALLDKEDRFNAGDRQVVGALASHVAMALESAIAYERLDQLERFKSEFLHVAAHELRGPVAIVRGYLEMLGEDPERWRSGQRVVMLQVTREKVEQIRSLVEQMLEAARLEERQPTLALRTVDLREVVSDAILDVANAFKPEHDVSIDVGNSPVLVRADSGRIRGAIANLVENACKYSPHGGPIQVRLRLAGTPRWAELEVADRGIGIDSQDMPRLFTRFGRIVNERNGNVPGTGLGLYLSQQVVQLHGGNISAESRAGQGSQFCLRLPLAIEKEP